MAYYKKGHGFIAAVYKTNLKIGSVIVPSAGKYLARSYGLDGASMIDVQLGELPSAITGFIGGDDNVTSMIVPPSVSNVKGIFTPVFPNLEKVFLGSAANDATLKDGLDTAYAGLNVDVYVLDTLLAGYQTKYASATNLTFSAVASTVPFEIPYVGETTLTAEYVRQVAADLGVLNTVFEKVIVPPEFTSFDANAFNMIWALFPNCGEIEYSAPRLPAEYQEVEYIESTGTQKIDTGLRNTTNSALTTFSIKYKLTSSARQIIFGETWNNNNNMLAVYNTQFFASYPEIQLGSADSNVHVFEFKDDYSVYFDNEYKGLADYQTPRDYGYYLCGSLALYPASAQFYELEMKANGALLRSFVPCYRRSDGEVGLYDLVGNQFYVNSGTGNFLKGSDNTTLLTITISRPSALTATIVGSGTLTAQTVAEMRSAYPELASAGKVVIPVEFTAYESGSIQAIQNQFTSLQTLTTCYENGNIDLDMNGDVVAKIVAIGKTVDGALVKARLTSQEFNTDWNGTQKQQYMNNNLDLVIFPPMGDLGALPNSGFGGSTNLVLAYAKTTAYTSLLNVFTDEGNLVEAHLYSKNQRDITNTFLRCYSLVKAEVEFGLAGTPATNNLFSGCSNLETLIMKNMQSGFVVSASTKFTRQALVDLINSLGTPSATKTLTIGATNLAKLTAAEIQVATDKNWVLA